MHFGLETLSYDIGFQDVLLNEKVFTRVKVGYVINKYIEPRYLMVSWDSQGPRHNELISIILG